MSYTALYRKWRPVSFEDVKGQDPIVQTLKNQITSDALAMHTCFAGQEVLVRPVLRKYMQERSTVSIR